ncbi:MAG: protein kinase domain-containing protein, partial [Terriglobales bacterium]
MPYELTDKLVPVEYSALPGAGLRKKVRKLDPAVRMVGLAFVPLALVAFSFTTMAELFHSILPAIPLLILVFAVVGFFITRDEIFIGEHGLSFPLPFMHKLGFRPTRLWAELAKIEVRSDTAANTAQGDATTITLTFSNGEEAKLALKNFSKDGINLFVGAAAEWATNCKFDKQFEQLPKLYEYETGNFKNISYTQFWEEQLANTYTFTAFVPLQVGHRLRNETLTVLSQIASGGFSAIYLVKSADGKKMVVKESVTPGSIDDQAKDKIREQFKREATLLVKLDHPSIARVYDHFVEGGRSYLLIEYIAGPDLRAYVRQ